MMTKLVPMLLVLVAGLSHGRSLERPHCTNANLSGDYVYTAHGTTLPALGLPTPLIGAFASSGSAHFDGNGQFTLTATSSFNGLIQGPATVSGTYSVNSDCSYTSQADNGVTFRAAIVDDGRQLLILQTNTGVVITGTAEKRFHEFREGHWDHEQGAKACDNSRFAGSYGFLAEGFAGAPILPGAPFAPLAGVGVVTTRRDGTFTMMAQRSVDGILDPAPLPLTGTYTFTGDCTAEFTFDAGFHFTATLVNKDEVLFIETDPGAALIVRAKRI
jgi:hypothetical protein